MSTQISRGGFAAAPMWLVLLVLFGCVVAIIPVALAILAFRDRSVTGRPVPKAMFIAMAASSLLSILLVGSYVYWQVKATGRIDSATSR